MSLRLRELYPDRDFDFEPLQREETQIYFVFDSDNPDHVADEFKFHPQQHLNEGGKLDTAKIVSHFFQHKTLTHTRDGSARYIDSTALGDFRSNMNSHVAAKEAYAALPLEIREKFKSPRDFVSYCLDEANIDQLREWGLSKPLKTVEAPKPIEVIVTNPEPSKGKGKAE